MMTKTTLCLEELRAYYKENFPLYAFIELEILEASPQHAKCAIPLSPNNVNHFGVLHAAVQWAAAETLGGVVFWSSFSAADYLIVVTDVSIHFHRPATTDLTSETSITRDEIKRMDEQLKHVGKAGFTLEIELKNASDTTVTKAVANYHVRKRELFPRFN